MLASFQLKFSADGIVFSYIRYEQLMAHELQYTHEINALEKKFNSWNESGQQSQPVRKPVSKLPSARDIAKDLPPEVVQFEVSS